MYKGKLGDYTMVPPLGVGHEASGVVTKCGSAVTSLKPGETDFLLALTDE